MKQLAVNGRKQELTKVLLLGILAGGLAIPGRALAADLAVTENQTGPVYADTGDGVSGANLTLGSVDSPADTPVFTGSVYGGMGTAGGSASYFDTVTLQNGSVTRSLYGAYDPDAATYNTATVYAGSVGENVYGGASVAAGAEHNTVQIGVPVKDGDTLGTISIGGSVYGNASATGGGVAQVTIGQGSGVTTTITGDVYGAYVTNGGSDTNTVTITGGSIGGSVYGSYGTEGSSNTLTLGTEGSTIGPSIGSSLYGAYGTSGWAFSNGLTINSGEVKGTVYGSWGSLATQNTLTVNGGTIDQGIYGGYATGFVGSNTITLKGGTVSGDIYAGYSTEGEANSNTINLYGGTLIGASLYGSNHAADTGNTLNVYTLGNTVANLGNFQNINFYIPEVAKNTADATMLTVTGTADVTGSTISAGVENINDFTTNQVITLLTDSNGITGLDGVTFGTLTDAGFAQTGFYLSKTADNNSVTLTIGTKPDDSGSGSGSGSDSGNSGSSDSGDVTPVAGDAVEITTGGTTASYGDYQTSYLTSAADNVVTVKSGTYTSSIYGSYGGDGGTSNKVSIGAAGTDGPSITGDVLGDSGTGTTYFNEVTVNSGTINGTVYGAKSNTATYNTITVNGGTITGGIYGAYSTSDANGDINGNTLNLLGGNTINLKGTDVTGASLYGAAGTGSGMDTNTLNVYTLGNSVVNLGGFQNINFYIPDTAKSTENATMLTVTDTADITNTAIKAGIEDLTGYTDGTVITLLTDANGLTGLTSATVGTITDAGFAQTGFYLTKSRDGKAIVLTIGEKPTDYVTIVTNGNTASYPDYQTDYLSSQQQNSVTLTGGNFAGDIYGAKATSGDTGDNKVTITAGTVQASVYGSSGGTGGGSNTVTLGASGTDGPTITGNVYAYDGTGVSSFDAVSVASGSVGGTIYGAKTDTATYNTVTVSGGSVGNIYGAYSSNSNGGVVDNNTVTLLGGTVTGDVYGAYGGAGGSNNVTLGAATTDGPKITGNVFAYDGTGITSGNKVTIASGSVDGTVYGGRADAVTSSTIAVNGGTVKNGIYGGYSTSGSSVDENVINLNDGTVSGNIYGGYSENGSVGSNVINLYSTDVSGASLYGGGGSGSTLSNNTLNVYTLGNSVVNLGNFQNINFYVPEDAKNTGSATMLTVTGSADVTGTAIKAGINDLTGYTEGQTITLLTDTNGITGLKTATVGLLTDSGFAQTGYYLVKSKDGKSLTLIIGEKPVDYVDISSNGVASTYPDYDPDYLALSSGNSVTVKGGSLTTDIYGAYTTSGGDTGDNKVTISAGSVTGSVYGASGGTGGGSNTVTLGTATTDGPTITGNVFAYDGTGITSGNTVTLNSGSVDGTVYGAKTDTATYNTVTVNGGTIDQGIYGGYATGFVGSNTITLKGGTVSGDVYAGYSTEGSVDGNTINLYSTDVSGASLYGGGGTGSEFTNNTLNVYTLGNSVANIGNFQNINFYVPDEAKNTENATMLTVTGSADITNTAIKAGIADLTGYTDGTVITLLTDDQGLTGLKSAAVGTLTDSGFAQTGYYLTKSKDGKSIALTIGTKPTDYVSIVTNGLTSTYPDYDTKYLANTKGNKVTITGSTFATNLYGAYASGVETSDNTVAVSAGTVNASIYGAFGGSSGMNNTVTVGAADTDGPTITGNLYAYDGTGITSGNTVTVNSGSVGGTVYGGRADAVTYNIVTVNGGTIDQGIYGGYATGFVGSNTITLKGGTVSGDVYAGYSTGGPVDGNTINLYSTNVSGASLYGGGGTGSEFTNNTLNVYTLGNSVVNIGNFQNINFYIPEEAKTTENATMLTVTGTADITNTAIKAGIADLTGYTEGTVITLLTDDNGLTGLKSAAVGTLTDSGFAQTGYYLTKSKDGNSIILTIGTKPTDYVSIVTNGLTSAYPDYDTEYLANTKGNTVTQALQYLIQSNGGSDFEHPRVHRVLQSKLLLSIEKRHKKIRAAAV